MKRRDFLLNLFGVAAGCRYFRVWPACHTHGGMRYHYWFDGDGMVQAFRFRGTGVSRLGRFVRTKKYAAESRV